MTKQPKTPNTTAEPVSKETLAQTVIDTLAKHKFKLTTAESCTGGLIAATVTDLPGASAVFSNGYVTYSNDAKTKMIGVERRTIEDYGAVSSQVARAMAEGAHRSSGSNIGLAVTGIAGPDGGSIKKPVGLVYLACATDNMTKVIERRFGDLGRHAIRTQTVLAALQLVLDTIEEDAATG
jgi:nicotinamide-nucleotide amidase